MREIHLIDTSVFCHILRVPTMGSPEDHAAAMAELTTMVGRTNVTLLLPMATIYETGNHIAKYGDGDARRKVALRFTKLVTEALNGKAPWIPTPLPVMEGMAGWLADFPAFATTGVGLGDLSIIRAYEQQRELNPHARVRIWTLDHHLTGYDHRPTGPLA